MNEHRKIIDDLISCALRSADPVQAVRDNLSISGHGLFVEDREYDLRKIKRIRVVGAGKAASLMARAVGDVLLDRVDSGLIIVKHDHDSPTSDLSPVESVSAGHPIPEACGVRATERIMTLAKDLGREDLLMTVISGGCSALLVSPAPGISLEDKQAVVRALLDSGASIHQINTVRKHLSSIKGGRLAQLAFPALTISLILSDVVGDALDTIGSGPTAPDPTTFIEAMRVLTNFDLVSSVPLPVIERLRRGSAGDHGETPTEDDPCFHNVQNTIIRSGRHAAKAAAEAAFKHGFFATLVESPLQGSARDAGSMIASMAKTVVESERPTRRPACLVFFGETTVNVTGDGRGGRNQELALATAIEIDGLQGVTMATLATDGQDGPTDAAGAVVDSRTIQRARKLGMDPDRYLANNDSYAFFDALDGLIRTGNTLTNVADLAFLLIS